MRQEGTLTMHIPRRLPTRTTLSRTGVAVTVLLLAAACGSSSAGSSGGKNKTLQLAFVSATTAQNPMQEMALGAKAAGKDAKNVNLQEFAPSHLNGPKEVSLFQSAMHTSTDGIAMETLSPGLMVRPLKQAAARNIPVVAVDTAPPPGTKVRLFVGNSNYKLGEKLGTAIIKRIPKGTKGNVVLGNDIPGLQVLGQRLKGLQSVLKKQRPELHLLGPYNSGSKPNTNYKKWSNIVKEHPNAVAYLGVGASDAVSLSLIKKKSGKQFIVGSCDPTPQALQYVKKGYVAALVSPEHWLKGYIAVSLLAKHARTGKQLPKGWWNPGSLVIDSHNIKQIIARQQSPQSRHKWFNNEVQKELAHPKKYLKPMSQAN
jgi:ribose transport system substrate-binding protein